MATEIMETRLRAALEKDARLTKRACRTRPLQPSGVGIAFGSIEAGVWHWRNGVFELHVDDSGPVAVVETVAEAVRHTREALVP